MMLNEGQVLNGRYQIESLIGQGGMSYVYRAHDQKMGRTVAIKVLKEEYCEDEEFIRKFQNEAQAAAKLNHPNIVAAYDVIDEGKLHCIVMELVEGITLKNYIQRKGKLNNREAIAIALQVIDGMEQAHKMGIVHRDIKPQNMIVSADGVVKVADFGIARAATQQTVNATVMGSVHYISPEQARTGVSDERSDIYSFGCTLYEMLTGKVPYDGENSVAVVLNHLDGQIPHVSELVPDVYPALDLAVYKCMQKRPGQRYQHIGELGKDLRQAIKDPGGSFMMKPEDADSLGDTRTLSDAERSSVKKRHRNRAEHIIEQLYKDEDLNSEQLDAKISRLYRIFAAVCIVVIVVLIIVIGRNVSGLLRAGTDITTAESSEETETEGQSEVNITISALETKLPNIIGMTLEEAEEYLKSYSIRLNTKDEEYSDRYNEGMIISYPDGNYSSGDTIAVTVSKGSQTLDFTNIQALNAMTLEELEKELKDREIPYDVKTDYSATIPAGNIISTSKPNTSGTATLVITVSEGKSEDMTTVPDLVGYTETDAIAALNQVHLLPGNITYEPSDSIAEGVVISQATAKGTAAAVSDYVSFTVSAGPNGVASVKAATSASPATEAAAWHSSINQIVTLGSGGPGITASMVVTIRLRQDYNGESHYTTLQKARSYPYGTELQVVFASINGEPGVAAGTVEVVDASTDTIISSFDCAFGP